MDFIEVESSSNAVLSGAAFGCAQAGAPSSQLSPVVSAKLRSLVSGNVVGEAELDNHSIRCTARAPPPPPLRAHVFPEQSCQQDIVAAAAILHHCFRASVMMICLSFD